MNSTTKRLTKLLTAVLLFNASIGAAAMPRKTNVKAHAFKISIPSRLGEVSQSYFPPRRARSSRPDFILIQNVHSNIFVQFAISGVLKQLDVQGLLPQRIAIEGGVGPIDVGGTQRNTDSWERREIARHLVTKGEMTGAAHYVVAEGRGDLYGVENNTFYQPSVEMFRRSYHAREALGQQLDQLDAAIALLKTEPGESSKAAILEQDIQVIRRLIDQQLLPTEIHQVMTRAVFAVEHLKHFVSGKKARGLIEPVSAAVNFYAFALLRDKGLFKYSEELRRTDRQRTTVLIAGGFHTPGITQFLKEEGYSYVVITPQVKAYKPIDERLYIQRLLGYPITLGKTNDRNAPLLTFPIQPDETARKETAQKWILASELREKLAQAPLSIPRVRDIFTALDHPLPKPLQLSLMKQRAQMLDSEQVALNRKAYLTR